MAEKEKKTKNNLVDQSVYDSYKDAIPEDQIWTFQVEGLQKPLIRKSPDNAPTLKVAITVVLAIAVFISIYFSFYILHNDPFKYTTLENGKTELTRFSNPGEIYDLRIDYLVTDVISESYIEKNDAGESVRRIRYSLKTDESTPIEEIHEYAFNCDERIRRLEIGANVTSIDDKAFYSCYALQEIRVDKENPNYRDIDGVLYSKDGTRLICYPIDHDAYLREKYGYEGQYWPTENWKTTGEDKYNEYYTKAYEEQINTYVVPSTVKEIGPLAMNYAELFTIYLPEGLEKLETMAIFRNWHLERVDTYTGEYKGETQAAEKFIPDPANVKASLPDSLTYIGSDCFNSAIEMDYIYIPANVTFIGHHAFWGAARKENDGLIGLYEIHAALDETAFKAQVDEGDQWTGQYDNGLLPKNVPVLYGEARAK